MKTTQGGVARKTLMLTGCLFAAAALASCGSADLGRTIAQPVVYEPQPAPAALLAEASPTAGQNQNLVDPAAMLAAHNRWRAEAGVPSLSWSEKLTGISQRWAEHLRDKGCAMVHSGNGYGENLYWSSPVMWSNGRRELKPKTAREVTDSWGSEIKDYNYADNSCSGVCGHYTQLVWRNTKEVGCAMAVCGDKAQIWVCTYDPPGNFAGQRPY